jgi:hypothetical protein
MVRAWKNLGQAGIEAAGGLDGVARQHNVRAAALRNYLRADGTLTQLGEDRLDPGGKARITGAMLQAWKNLGKAGIKAAGGLDGVARRDNIPAAALRNYLRANGTLTKYGEYRLRKFDTANEARLDVGRLDRDDSRPADTHRVFSVEWILADRQTKPSTSPPSSSDSA